MKTNKYKKKSLKKSLKKQNIKKYILKKDLKCLKPHKLIFFEKWFKEE